VKITKEWINDHRTVNGAFTGAQTKILHQLFNCKPWVSGWMERIEGREISEKDAKAFEEARFTYANATKKAIIMKEPTVVEEELAQIKKVLNLILKKLSS
jgi:hypothetical protein